jgi:hypothetical protein
MQSKSTFIALNRATFGPSTEELARVEKMGQPPHPRPRSTSMANSARTLQKQFPSRQTQSPHFLAINLTGSRFRGPFKKTESRQHESGGRAIGLHPSSFDHRNECSFQMLTLP